MLRVPSGGMCSCQYALFERCWNTAGALSEHCWNLLVMLQTVNCQHGLQQLLVALMTATTTLTFLVCLLLHPVCPVCRLITNLLIGTACMIGFLVFRTFMKQYQLRSVSICARKIGVAVGFARWL